MGTEKPWGGRFSAATNRLVEAFTESLSFDRALYAYDIRGSIAHCRMLAKQGIIAKKDSARIVRALKEIRTEIESGSLDFDASHEDIHMRIEARLIEKVGPVGGKLHTARSRNDQVALDTTLYLRDALLDHMEAVLEVQRALLQNAKKNIDIILPGFTHLQHAQPVLLSHHLLAYFEMFERDRQRLADCYTRINRMPLGSGALAGTPFPIDREYVADLLGFPSVTFNSMDAVADRDGLIEYCSCSAIIMMHLSRLCEELILWSSQEFQFVEIDDAFCTGSSIMPQKKNPDVPELVRGKTGRVYGNLMSLLTLLKSLPLAYNRDLQEDKEALFDTVRTTGACLRLIAALLPALRVNGEAMRAAADRGFLTATDLADYLASHDVPFREAHELVGRIVAHCIKKNISLADLRVEDFRRFGFTMEPRALQRLHLSESVNSRTCTGGTARAAVARELRRCRTRLQSGSRFVETESKKISKKPL